MSDGPPGGPPPPPPGQPGQPGQPGWGQPPPAPPPGYGQGYGQQPPPQPQYYGPYSQPPKNDGTAVAVLVLGICSLVFIWFCPFVLSIVALCLAPGARRNIAQSGGTVTGDGMVKTGVILSWISIGLGAVGAIVFILLVAIGASTDSNSALALLTPLTA